ncbi:MAG: tetratricopeptide repeat protein [Fibrobacterota bacterium]
MGILNIFEKKVTPSDAYGAALHNVILGNLKEAESLLVKVVSRDSSKAAPYFHLAEIFRKTGRISKAEKTYNSILTRKDTPASVADLANEGLFHVYESRKEFRRAEAQLEKIHAEKNAYLGKRLLKLYERHGEWDEAFKLSARLDRKNKENNSWKSALYRVRQGMEILNKDPRGARLKFHEAIKIDPGCAEAYYRYGLSYLEENRADDAVKIWQDFIDALPGKSFIIFPQLESIYFEAGKYGKIEGLYGDILKKDPRNTSAMLALARHFSKTDRTDKALENCRKVLDIDPDKKDARHLLIKLLSLTGDVKALMRTVHDLVDMQPSKEEFICSECGKKVGEPSWYCDDCGAWNSYGI